MIRIVIFFLISQALAKDPDWINQQRRTIINGYILHWGMGVSENSDLAKFKAENMAYKSLIIECGVAHKEIKLWDQFQKSNGRRYTQYARAGISFEECEEGKRKDNKKYVNPELIKSQKLYERIIFRGNETKSSEKTLLEIKKYLQNSETKLLNRFKKLEKKIESKSPSVIIIPEQKNTVIYKKQILKGGAAKKEECLAEYDSILKEAELAALDSKPIGNLMYGKAKKIYLRAQRKLRFCEKIQ